ncbi:MAG: Crp/Fnr family transcriptional regulator, partial [Actinomycetota bacterium]|nr:Crp/Fnr family transcriptional regulator [Actinomycetota bacterium]
LFIVKQGRIRLNKVGSKGNEITVAMVNRGKLFGEMALTAQRTREVYAQAAEPSLLISLNREALENLILEKPRVGLRLTERLSERVRALEYRLEDATLKKMPARLANLILQLVESEGERTEEGYHKIPTHYSHDELASMVGANRVSVTKAIGRLRESGVVELRRRLIYVKDLQALGNIATEPRRAKQIKDSED